MSTTKLKLSLIGAMVTASLVAALAIQHQTQEKLLEKNAELQQLDGQLAKLGAENQRLSNAVVQAANPAADDQAVELAKLRTEAQALQKQINELGRGLAENRPSRVSQAASRPIQHTPEYWAQLHQLAGGKTKDAMILAMALLEYASGHGGQIPSSFDQLESHLQNNKDAVLTGTNEFDIVYQGSLDQIKNIPLGEVALLRDRQAWPAPSGKVAKVYAMVDGSGQIVESDDNFQAWEADHIVVPTPTGQSGQ